MEHCPGRSNRVTVPGYGAGETLKISSSPFITSKTIDANCFIIMSNYNYDKRTVEKMKMMTA